MSFDITVIEALDEIIAAAADMLASAIVKADDIVEVRNRHDLNAAAALAAWAQAEAVIALASYVGAIAVIEVEKIKAGMR